MTNLTDEEEKYVEDFRTLVTDRRGLFEENARLKKEKAAFEKKLEFAAREVLGDWVIKTRAYQLIKAQVLS